MIALELVKVVRRGGRTLMMCNERQGRDNAKRGTVATRKPRLFGHLPGGAVLFEINGPGPNLGTLKRTYPTHKGTGDIAMQLLKAWERGQRQAVFELQQPGGHAPSPELQGPAPSANQAGQGSGPAQHESLAGAPRPGGRTKTKPGNPQPIPQNQAQFVQAAFGPMLLELGLAPPMQDPPKPLQLATGDELPGDDEQGGTPAMQPGEETVGAAVVSMPPVNHKQLANDMDALSADLADLEAHFDTARAATGGRL